FADNNEFIGCRAFAVGRSVVENVGRRVQNGCMDFEKRLQKAIERGQKAGDVRGRALQERALGEEELKTLHSQYRLELSEHIEGCLKKLSDHFPGFRYTPLYGDEGWGATVTRDDVGWGEGRRAKSYLSRLEMLIRSFSSVHIIEFAAKGTIRNKEVFSRSHYQ